MIKCRYPGKLPVDGVRRFADPPEGKSRRWPRMGIAEVGFGRCWTKLCWSIPEDGSVEDCQSEMMEAMEAEGQGVRCV